MSPAGRAGKTGAVLLAVGAALGIVASFGEMWSLRRVPPQDFDAPEMGNFRLTATLWKMTAEQEPLPDWYEPPGYGLPLVVCLMLMAVVAVLSLRGARIGGIGRIAALAFSSAFGGILLGYLVELRSQERLNNRSFSELEIRTVYTWQQGLYGLIVAAVLGLAGAVLLQRLTAQPVTEAPVAEESEHPEGVVIHQLDDASLSDNADTDTPPFGIAPLHPDDEERR